MISDRIKQMAVSQTLAMSQKSQELRAAGVDVINLSVGEPDFPTPSHIKRAAIEAIEHDYSHYTPVPGYPELRKAICNDLKRTTGVDYDPAQIVVGNGAKHAIANVLLATLNPGDEVIIPVPAWVSYVELVKLAGAIPVTVASGIEADFKISPEQLREAITPRTRMIMICSPSNPTGSVYSRDELRALTDVLADYPDILILADEIYCHINFTGEFTSLASFEKTAARTVLINGVSKAYAMTGWRIGFAAAPTEIAKAVTKLQGQMTSNASSIAQKAAEAAYNGPQECVETMRAAFEQRRNLVVELAKQVPGWRVNCPDGAFYLFPDVSALLGLTAPDGKVIADDNDLAMYLLEHAHVATVSGTAFCMPGYLRLSYAASEDDIRRAIERISAAVAQLR